MLFTKCFQDLWKGFDVMLIKKWMISELYVWMYGWMYGVILM